MNEVNAADASLGVAAGLWENQAADSEVTYPEGAGAQGLPSLHLMARFSG
jgi:hypothetical protein